MSTYITSIASGKYVKINRNGTQGPQGPQGDPYQLQEYTLTLEGIGLHVVDSIPMADYRSAIYNIQVLSNTGYKFSEVRIIHDSVNVYLIESGEVIINSSGGTFSAALVDDQLVLYVTTVQETTNITFKRLGLTNDGDYYVPFPGDLMLQDDTIDLQLDEGTDVDLMTF